MSVYDWLKNTCRQKYDHMINMVAQEESQMPFDCQRTVSLLEKATQFCREHSGGRNFEIQPVGSRRNEPHSSQRLQVNHTRFPHTTTILREFADQNRQGNEDNILSKSLHKTVL